MGDKTISVQRQGFTRRVIDRVFGQSGELSARSSSAESVSRLQQWVSRVGRGNYSNNLQSAYHEIVAVYRCVNVIARAVARAPLQVYVGETLVTDGPVAALLERPNPYMTQARFVEMVAVQTLLNGNGYIRAETGDLSKEILWLLPISPQNVKPIRDAGNPYSLHGWRIKSQGGIRDVGPQEMIHIPYSPDPSDPLLGVSPLGVARLVVETDFDAALYNQSILKNSGNLSGILKWLGDDPLTDEEVSALSQRWNDNYAGADRAGKTAVLSGNFEFQATAATLRDMQFLEARKWNLADIARAFSVPLVFLNEYESSGLSDAGLRVQERMLYHQTVIPFARQIEQALSEFIKTQFTDRRLSVVFNFDVVEALSPETTAKLEQAQRLATLGYPINIINSVLDLGMPVVPWGDDALVAVGLTTAQAVIDMATLPPDVPDLPLPVVTIEPPADSPQPQLSTTSILPDATPEPVTMVSGDRDLDIGQVLLAEDSRAALWRTIDDRSQEHYRATLGRIRRALLKMRRQALEALDAKRSNVRAPISQPDNVANAIDGQELVSAIRARAIAAFVSGYEDAFADVGVAQLINDAGVFSLSREEINRIAELYFDRGLGRVVEIGNRVKEMVRDTLIEGQTDGEALNDLADRVRDVFNASAARATTIARTETQIALNGGAQSRYERELPPEAQLQWLSSRDSKVRDSHAEVDGEMITLGDIYTNGLGFPCDPSGPPEEIVNCRCYQIPVIQGIADPLPQWDPEEE